MHNVHLVWHELRREKDLFLGCAKINDANQYVQMHRLMCAFVIHVFKSIIYKLATSETLFLELISVAEETGLSLALSKTPKTSFFVWRHI